MSPEDIKKQEELRKRFEEEQRKRAEQIRQEEELRRIKTAFSQDKERLEKGQEGRPKDERPQEDE